MVQADRAAWCAVGLAAASIFCMGGVIFGIASLYPVLYYERALELSSCGSDDTCAARSDDKCCTDQQLQYTLMSSIALFVADGAMLLYGEIADRLGPRTCYGIGAGLAWLGMVLLAVGARVGNDACWYIATFALGASGPGVFMGCLMLGEKYPQLHGVISAVAASMWDASALVLMLFNGAYFATASDGERPAFGLDGIALSWLCLTVPLGVLTWKVLPSLAEVEQLRGEGGSAAEETDTRSLTGFADDAAVLAATAISPISTSITIDATAAALAAAAIAAGVTVVAAATTITVASAATLALSGITTTTTVAGSTKASAVLAASRRRCHTGGSGDAHFNRDDLRRRPERLGRRRANRPQRHPRG